MDIKQLPPGSMSSTTARVPRRWIVKTDRGIISATDVIVATNAWTSNLLPDFKGKIVPVKGHCSALSPPQTLKDKRLPGAYAIVRKDRRRAEYLIQRPNGDIVVGGGRWLQNNQGVGQADDSTVEEDVVRYLRSVPGKSFTGESGWTTSNSATSRSNDKSPSEPDWTHVSLPPSSPKPQSDPPHLLGPKQEWTGIMGFSSDGRPWVGPLPGSPGLWIIAGMEGHGMAYATGCAAALVDMLVHTPSPPPPLSLSSSFHRGRRNWDVETSFYGIRQAKGMPSMNHTLWFPSSFLVTQERMERKGLGALAGFDQGMELDEWDRDVMSELGSIKQYELTTDESGVEVLENGLFEVDLNSEGSEEDWVVL